MITLSRYTPMILQDRITYVKGSTTIHRDTPVVEAGSLILQGNYKLLTPDGDRALGDLKTGDRIMFIPERPVAFGKGMDTVSGTTFRRISPSEMWALGVGWTSGPKQRLKRMEKITGLTAEYDTILDPKNTFLFWSPDRFYHIGLNNLDNFQLRAFLRGCLFGIASWDTDWETFDKTTQNILNQRMLSPVGRFISHMGILVQSWSKRRLVPEVMNDTKIQLSENTLLVGNRTFELKVTATRYGSVPTTEIPIPMKARIPGISVEGLSFRNS